MKDERASEFCHRFVAYFLQYAELHSKTTKEDFDALESEKDNVLNAMDVAFEIQDWESVMPISCDIMKNILICVGTGMKRFSVAGKL